MPSRNLRPISRQLLQYAHFLTRNQILLAAVRHCSGKDGNQEEGDCDWGPECDCDPECDCELECDCGPECDCPHWKKVCYLGVRPICCRDPPSDYESPSLGTKTFEIPDFMDPKVFRPMKEDEVLGPNADKVQTYKNPEFFSYHRFSYYELKLATLMAKEMAKSD